jgi:hypothetical protein
MAGKNFSGIFEYANHLLSTLNVGTLHVVYTGCTLLMDLGDLKAGTQLQCINLVADDGVLEFCLDDGSVVKKAVTEIASKEVRDEKP